MGNAAHELEIVMWLERHRQQQSDVGVVVRYQHPRAACRHRGLQATGYGRLSHEYRRQGT